MLENEMKACQAWERQRFRLEFRCHTARIPASAGLFFSAVLCCVHTFYLCGGGVPELALPCGSPEKLCAIC